MNRDTNLDLSPDLARLDAQLSRAGQLAAAEPTLGVSAGFSKRLLARMDAVGDEPTGPARVIEVPLRHAATQTRRLPRLWLATAAAVALFAAVSALTISRGPAAIIEYREGASGTAEGQRDVAAGSAIETHGGRLVAQMDGRAHVLIDKDSKVEFVRANSIRLLRGQVWVHVVPHSGAYSVQTPDARVDVIGTVFQVRADGKGSSVEVSQGTVRFSSGGGEASVPAGKAAQVANSQSSPRLSDSFSASDMTWAEELAKRNEQHRLSTYFPSMMSAASARK